MSLAVSPLLTPMGRSDAGTDPAARALQALVQMASTADAPLEALVKAVAANNLTTLSVNGETLQVRLSVALPLGTALTIAPTPGNAAAVSVQVKPQAIVAQMAPAVPAQAASAAIVSAMTAAPVSLAPVRTTPLRQPPANLSASPTSPPEELELSSAAPPATGPVAKPLPAAAARPPVSGATSPVTSAAADVPASPMVEGRAANAALQVATRPTAGADVAHDAEPVPNVPAPAELTKMAQPGRVPASASAPVPLAEAAPPVVAPSALPAGPLPNATAPTVAAGAAPPPLRTPVAAPAQPVPPAALPTNPPASAQIAGAPPLTGAVQTLPATPLAAASAPPAVTATVAAPEAADVSQMPEAARPAPIPYATAPRPSAPTAGAAQPPDLARAIATQQPLAPMLADAVKLAADPAMPQPLRAAAQQVVANALDPTRAPLDAATLKQAVESAGVLRPLSPLASPDLANRLTALRNVLASLLGDDAVGLPNDRRRLAGVPLRGDAPHAERSEMVPLADEAPRGLAHRLLAETDGALSRLKLLQSASLPADGRAPDPARPAEYRVEVPMLLGREATTIQFVFDREAQPQEPKKPRGWRMRFALNVAALGEVGADISILGAATQVTVWASETETAALIEQMLPDLAPALAARGLEPGAIRMRHGRPGSVAAGRLVDSAR